MGRKAPNSVAGLVEMLVQEGFTDTDTVVYAVKDTKPTASEAQIRKALAAEIVQSSQARNGR